MNIYKFGSKFTTLTLLSALIFGCGTAQPKRSSGVLFSFITPQIRISDTGFIHSYTNGTQVQIYNSGTLTLNLKLAQNICINAVCSDRQSFNTKYLKSAHYDEIIDDIISKKPIYEAKNLNLNSCGFKQEIAMLSYEVCDDLVKFIDNQNRVKIIIRELK